MIPPNSLPFHSKKAERAPWFSRGWLRLFFFFATAPLAGIAAADEPPTKAEVAPEFLPAVQLTPFVVNGKPFSISIHARSKSDRRYAEGFAEDVIAVAYETLDGAVGDGLVIMGKESEPHPVFVFRKFVTMANAGQLDPGVAASATEMAQMLEKWEAFFRPNESNPRDDIKLEFDQIVEAIPLPLEGIGSKLYQLAWTVNFDDARVAEVLRSLTPADLKADQLSKFDWVFYLPPRSAFDRALKKVLPGMMKQKQLGVFKRAAVRSALVVFKPAVRKAMEAARKGFLFMTVLRAKSDYSQEEIQLLTAAYVRVLMPDFKFNDRETPQRAMEAIEAQKIENAEYANDPFVSPPPLTSFDAAAFAAFEGDYAEGPKTTHRFRRNKDTFTWQYLEREPAVFRPAGPQLFVSGNGQMTIEFLQNDSGEVTGVEERWVRRRKTVPRAPENGANQPTTKS